MTLPDGAIFTGTERRVFPPTSTAGFGIPAREGDTGGGISPRGGPLRAGAAPWFGRIHDSGACPLRRKSLGVMPARA